MKHLKQKLMAAVSMLMVSFLMLTSASYAWFTISVTPEVKEIKTTVQANENFEIALGTDATTKPADSTYDDTTGKTAVQKDQTWGATVTSLTDLKGLGPAQLHDGAIQSALYGEDGRPKGLDPVNEGDISDGQIILTDDDGHVIGHKILLWLRSNKSGDVKVEVSGVKFGDDEGNKVQVAFQWEGGNITLTGTEGIENGAGTIAKLGNITADEPTPVYVYIYLEGENVTNADVEAQVDVTIASIKFSMPGVVDGGVNTYYHDPLNTSGNKTAQ